MNNIFSKYFKCILLFTGCFSFYVNTNAQNWDINLLNNINPTNPNANFWVITSNSLYPVSVISPASILVTGFIKKDKILQQKGWKALSTLVINSGITYGLKYTINRDRPYVKYPLIIYPYNIESSKSLPSGHTSTAFATAASLSINFKKWYVVVPAYTWAASVGYSRMYLGVHYPTDVFAGAIVGVGSAYLSHWLNKKIFPPKQ